MSTDMSSQATAEQVQAISDNLPLNYPRVYYTDLNDNSTRYDRLIASATDDQRHLMWSLWTGITLLCSLATVILCIAILCSRRARKNHFNLYLVFLIIPDVFFNVNCLITCVLSAAAGKYFSAWMCHYQSFYVVFGISANAWMNALVTRELYICLSSAQKFVRYKPPPKKTILVSSLAVYLFSIFIASLPFLGEILSWFPHRTQLKIGVACFPVEFNLASTVFLYVVFLPAVMGIPFAYVFYTMYRILKDRMMPTTGKRRELVIFFFRLAVVFLIMWAPGLVVMFITSEWSNPWWTWGGGAWVHLQGFVSTAASLLKPDVWQAVKELLTCHTCEKPVVESGSNRHDLRDLSSNSPEISSAFLRHSWRLPIGRLHTLSASSTRITLGTGSFRCSDQHDDARTVDPFGPLEHIPCDIISQSENERNFFDCSSQRRMVAQSIEEACSEDETETRHRDNDLDDEGAAEDDERSA